MNEINPILKYHVSYIYINQVYSKYFYFGYQIINDVQLGVTLQISN